MKFFFLFYYTTTGAKTDHSLGAIIKHKV